jgi:hypothetical protein
MARYGTDIQFIGTKENYNATRDSSILCQLVEQYYT